MIVYYVLLMIFLLPISTFAADYQIIDVASGNNEDLYFEINLSGKVYVRIVTEPGGEACADFWWIKWPFGNIQQLGRQCNGASFDIPSIFSGAISSKLRVGGAKNRLKLVISATEEVANKVTIKF